VDPAASEFNQYSYASNNPYRFVDPDGRMSSGLCDIGGCDAGSFSSGSGETPRPEKMESTDHRSELSVSSGTTQSQRDAQGTARRNQEAIDIGTYWVKTAWHLFVSQFTGDAPGVGLAGGAGLLREAGVAEEVGVGLRNGRLAGEVHPVTGIPFKSTGYPNFSGVAKVQVRIVQTGTRAGDFRAANAAAGLRKTPEGYTWHHHEDGTTMELVPRDIHAQTGHTGGFNGGN
jgi:hypothetical protein